MDFKSNKWLRPEQLGRQDSNIVKRLSSNIKLSYNYRLIYQRYLARS